MNSAIERLLSLKVADVITCDVVTVSANSTMSEAADALSGSRISGAPVVDETGRCIGVLSGTDFIHGKAAELDSQCHQTHVLTSHDPGGVFRIEEVMHDLVRSHMSTAVQTIDQKCSLIAGARCMCGEHIHRLIAVDERGAPVGVLSSLDVVAALVKAVQE